MTTDSMIAEFEAHHRVTLPSFWPQGSKLVGALLSAREEVKATLAAAVSSLGRDPTFGLLFHLTERIYEQVTGSICCFSTKNAAAAEVTARVALESTANLRYMLAGERPSRVLAWLRSYVVSDSKQISKWEELVATMPPELQPAHRASGHRRRQASAIRVDVLRDAVQTFESIAPLDQSAKWPTVADRFAGIGESVAYRTAYARLSSQTHADAEDTINYILGSVAGGELTLSEETVAFSSFLVHFAETFYLRALDEFCRAFGIRVPDAVAAGLLIALEEMARLQSEWAW